MVDCKYVTFINLYLAIFFYTNSQPEQTTLGVSYTQQFHDFQSNIFKM